MAMSSPLRKTLIKGLVGLGLSASAEARIWPAAPGGGFGVMQILTMPACQDPKREFFAIGAVIAPKEGLKRRVDEETEAVEEEPGYGGYLASQAGFTGTGSGGFGWGVGGGRILREKYGDRAGDEQGRIDVRLIRAFASAGLSGSWRLGLDAHVARVDGGPFPFGDEINSEISGVVPGLGAALCVGTKHQASLSHHPVSKGSVEAEGETRVVAFGQETTLTASASWGTGGNAWIVSVSRWVLDQEADMDLRKEVHPSRVGASGSALLGVRAKVSGKWNGLAAYSRESLETVQEKDGEKVTLRTSLTLGIASREKSGPFASFTFRPVDFTGDRPAVADRVFVLGLNLML